MKILFVSSYIDNSHFIKLQINNLKKNLVNCDFNFIVLNDAPDIDNGDENYLKIISILTGNKNSYKEIYNESLNNGADHIKIPQNIHIKNRHNHSSFRHSELLTYFIKNINKLYPTYKSYDYLCIIDSDVILINKFNPTIDLNNIDIAAPLIFTNLKKNIYYPHVGLFFINLNTVHNFNNMVFDTMSHDTGYALKNFINNNKQYSTKELARYNNWDNKKAYNSKGKNKIIIKNKICDLWFDNKFLHLRGGSCFSVGSLMHSDNNKIDKYKNNINDILKYFDIKDLL